MTLENMLKKRGMTQYDLAEATGIPQGQISRYVAGAMTPGGDKAEAIARELGVSVYAVLGKHPPKERGRKSGAATTRL